MGNCMHKIESFQTEKILKFNEIVDLRIKPSNLFSRSSQTDRVTFKVTHPIHRFSEPIRIGPSLLQVSGAVLPGLDPRKINHKECQDLFFVSSKHEILLGCLFDGHGREGQKVAYFCSEFMKTYFEENIKAFKSNNEQEIEKMVFECEEALKNSNIEIKMSGTTAVILYMDASTLVVGSVGDSRAVLARIPNKYEDFSESECENNDQKRFGTSRFLEATALSVDQKPNDYTEHERIKKAGGTVSKLLDLRGNKVGPYRVWKRGAKIPGLAMSRSIGDSLAKEVGVISTPILQTFPICEGTDKFIVIGSDGVWDVMENEEVVDFVETHKRKSEKSVEKCSYPVTAENSLIAHLLAEECRSRWYKLCEGEDVIIDDISVVIIEFETGPETVKIDVPIVTKKMESVLDIEEEISDVEERSDPVRNNVFPSDSSLTEKKRDPLKENEESLNRENENILLESSTN